MPLPRAAHLKRYGVFLALLVGIARMGGGDSEMKSGGRVLSLIA